MNISDFITVIDTASVVTLGMLPRGFEMGADGNYRPNRNF